MAITMDLGRLGEVVAKDAAIRRVQKLQPAGGPGDKIFPPTYPGEGRNAAARHVFETRRIDGEDVRCVLIDSVQSQANRLEEVLVDAVRRGLIAMPHLEVGFAGRTAEVGGRTYDLSDLGTITSLQAPHRIFDAIVRDSELDGKPFLSSDLGERLKLAKPQDARAIFQASPTALLFGAWNSHGEGGGLGAKFGRCIVSEIVGVRALDGQKTSSRIDPLGIRADVSVKGEETNWQIAEDTKGPGLKRPSQIGHSNIRPEVAPGGVTIDWALHTAVITCPGLRRLKFPDKSVKDENAGRAVLAALGLAALALQDEAGYALRSRCDLVCEKQSPFETVHLDGTMDQFDLTAEETVSLLNDAVAAAKKAGFPWNEKPIALRPQQRLVDLVARSRAKGLAGELEADEG